jgi:selenocysteine lyase/cysteine desulfurase
MRIAREQVAALIGAGPDAVVFTGSGSEANNLAIRGTVLANPARPARVITQATEHPAVLATCRALHRLHGVQLTILPVDRHGLVDPQDLAAAITTRTPLVSIMLANNETGTIQPIAELARIVHSHGVPIHTDAAQAVGKIPVDVAALDVDLLTVVGHKMYAPKGIAALYVKPGLRLEPVIYGGGQEHGLRAGTETWPSPWRWVWPPTLPGPTWPAAARSGSPSSATGCTGAWPTAYPARSHSTAIRSSGCPTHSTPASAVYAAMSCSPSPRASRPPPARPVTPGRPSPRPC